MDYCTSTPSPQLSMFVKQYWTIENCMPQGEKHIQRIVPNGLTEMMFYFGDKPTSTDRSKSVNDNSIITGQSNHYYDLHVTGRLSLFSVIFQPWGLSMLFDIPAGELFNNNVPLRYLLKDMVNELESQLFEADSFEKRISITELFLMKQVKRASKKYQFNRIKESIYLINNNQGDIAIDDLASKACFSRKQFERTFMDIVGISPKQFLKIVRFQNAINLKSRNKSTSLTSLTYQCGYYDQAHMSNEFLKLSGMTPKQYFRDCDPYSDYFQ